MVTKHEKLKLVPNLPPAKVEFRFDEPKNFPPKGEMGESWMFSFKMLEPYPSETGQLEVGQEVVLFTGSRSLVPELKQGRRGQKALIHCKQLPGQRFPEYQVEWLVGRHLEAPERRGGIYDPDAPIDEGGPVPTSPTSMGAPREEEEQAEQKEKPQATDVMFRAYQAALAVRERLIEQARSEALEAGADEASANMQASAMAKNLGEYFLTKTALTLWMHVKDRVAR